MRAGRNSTPGRGNHFCGPFSISEGVLTAKDQDTKFFHEQMSVAAELAIFLPDVVDLRPKSEEKCGNGDIPVLIYKNCQIHLVHVIIVLML